MDWRIERHGRQQAARHSRETGEQDSVESHAPIEREVQVNGNRQRQV